MFKERLMYNSFKAANINHGFGVFRRLTTQQPEAIISKPQYFSS